MRIHNGIKLVPFFVTENNIGSKFGKFSFTKRRVFHRRKRRKKRKK